MVNEVKRAHVLNAKGVGFALKTSTHVVLRSSFVTRASKQENEHW